MSGDGYFAELRWRAGDRLGYEAIFEPYIALDITNHAADGSKFGPVRSPCGALPVIVEGLVERGDIAQARALAHQWIALYAVKVGTLTPPAALVEASA